MKRLPFGLSCSPFEFQRLMNRITAGYQYIFCCSYIDDLIIYSQDWSSYMMHLQLVFDRLLAAGLRTSTQNVEVSSLC